MIKYSIVILAVLFGAGLSTFVTPTKAGMQSESTESGSMNVNIKLFTFKPKTLEVPVGTKVVWANGDAVEHTVTHGTPEEPADAFDSVPFSQGNTFSFVFENAGNYSYYCMRHDFMRGEIWKNHL